MALLFNFLSCGGGKTTPSPSPNPNPPSSIAVAGLTLSRNTMTLAVSDATGTLVPTISPHDATNKNIAWSSSSPAIASVSTNGVVTPLTVGKATITATSQDGGKTAECYVEVVADPIPATGAYLNRNELSITEGGSGAFALNFVPAIATNQNATWRSSNEAVATVDANGCVTAKAEGAAEITATFQQTQGAMSGPTHYGDGGGNVRASASATVQATLTVGAKSKEVRATGVAIDQKTMELSTGGNGLLFPTVLPANATNVNVTFSSSDPAVARVSSLGLVTGRAAGTATITVTTEDGGHKDACAVTVANATVNPTAVSLNKTAIELGDIGETERLAATVTPFSATDKSLYWLSSDQSAAAVNANGTVQARGKGIAIVTVETQVGGFRATCAVTVRGPVIRPTSVTLNKSQLPLSVGGTETLVATVLPSDAANKNVGWSSNNPNVATVSSNGLVSGISAGQAIVTVTTEDAGRTDSCMVTVTNVAVSDVSLNKTSLRLTVGGQEQLACAIKPSNATNKNVDWSSSDSGVATVSDGLVAAIAAGTATITVKTDDGNKTATCNVTVNSGAKPGTPIINLSGLNADGTATVSKQYLVSASDPKGLATSFTATANNGGSLALVSGYNNMWYYVPARAGVEIITVKGRNDAGESDAGGIMVQVVESSGDDLWYQGNVIGQIHAYPSGSDPVVTGGVFQFQFGAGDPMNQNNRVKSWGINGGQHPGKPEGENAPPPQAQISSGGLFTFAPTADVYPNAGRILFGVRANFEQDNVIAYQDFYITIVPNSTSAVKVVAVGPPLVFRGEQGKFPSCDSTKTKIELDIVGPNIGFGDLFTFAFNSVTY